jgi:hypothetical protein
MDWQAKLVAAMVTALGVFGLTAIQGCLSATSPAPATSIIEQTQSDDERADKEVQHQPTILRAEAAVPPISDRPGEWPLSPIQAGDSFAQSESAEGMIDAKPAQVADLLPIQPMNAPLPNPR